MKKEFLFRGIVPKDYNENFFKEGFVYGSLILDGDSITSIIMNDEYEAEVKTETVTQFTGMYDDNGDKVFGGDIIKQKNGLVFEIYWDEEYQYCMRSIEHPEFNRMLLNSKNMVDKSFKYTIIGNIFQNDLNEFK